MVEKRDGYFAVEGNDRIIERRPQTLQSPQPPCGRFGFQLVLRQPERDAGHRFNGWLFSS